MKMILNYLKDKILLDWSAFGKSCQVSSGGVEGHVERDNFRCVYRLKLTLN